MANVPPLVPQLSRLRICPNGRNSVRLLTQNFEWIPQLTVPRLGLVLQIGSNVEMVELASKIPVSAQHLQLAPIFCAQMVLASKVLMIVQQMLLVPMAPLELCVKMGHVVLIELLVQVCSSVLHQIQFVVLMEVVERILRIVHLELFAHVVIFYVKADNV
jgi:hypothetical protein